MADTPRRLADDTTLIETLRYFVPLLIAHLGSMPPAHRHAVAHTWRSNGARILGERGDLLMFRSTPAWDRRRANAGQHLIQAMAAAAVLQPDGVDFGPLHWCLQFSCARCHPATTRQPLDVRAVNAELERLDAEYRALCGLPPYQPPAIEATPTPVPQPKPRRRPIITVHLPEVA